MPQPSLFDRLRWRDPVTRAPLEPVVTARTPQGLPICGALVVKGTKEAYPIVDCVARLTPELATEHQQWLVPLGLEPVRCGSGTALQEAASVASFGFQWSWNSQMRSEADLRWRVADRFGVPSERFRDRVVLDAGAGAGDQSAWLLKQGAAVVSIDLSAAIDVVARKLRQQSGWVGVQGDITALPWEGEQFEMVYCEGVIQHTRDSALTVKELCRVLTKGGLILATHYGKAGRPLAKAKAAYMAFLRRRLMLWDPYKLMLLTGNFAALAYVPVLGRLLRLTGTAIHYDLMPDFKTTWTNTFDSYGPHAYQRHVSSEEFWDYFRQAGNLKRVYSEGTTIVAERVE